VDPEAVLPASARAIDLILEVAGEHISQLI
jgi:hypothetical protein